MNYLEAQLGFKGERGYSAYEIAVQNGYEGTEQDWLATLGTSSHLTQEKVQYTSSEGQTEFNLPSNYTTDTFVDVYVDGTRLTSDEYTISNNKVVLDTGLEADKTVELIEMTMSTNNLPIVTTIDGDSTDSTSPSTKSVYNNVLEPLNANISTVEGLACDVNSLKNDMEIVKNINFFYPIGSIYMSINSNNPSELFGGIWESIEGQFLIGVGTHADSNNETFSFSAGESFGEYRHKLTIKEIPSHNHNYLHGFQSVGALPGGQYGVYDIAGTDTTIIQNTGGGEAHNNMPPYLAVYMWKRVA